MYVYDVYDPKNIPTYTTVTIIHPPKNEQEIVEMNLAIQNSKETYEKEKEKSNDEMKHNEL